MLQKHPQNVGWYHDDGFAKQLSTFRGTLAVSTYQGGKLILISWDGHRVRIDAHHCDRPMGLAVEGTRVAIACRHEVMIFEDIMSVAGPPASSTDPGPISAQATSTVKTGDGDIHDIAFVDGELWMVNTRRSCLCLASSTSLKNQWHPPFISQVVPEDRCHLNGMALSGGIPAYVTAHGATDVQGTWRANRTDGGVFIDVGTGEPVVRGLCMPHSPRHHNGRWWALNSGRGELCVIDPEHGTFQAICTLPGYTRGLCFIDNYAVVGLSRIRTSHLFDGLPVQQNFNTLHCGLSLVCLRTGAEVGRLTFIDYCDELYDVQFISSPIRVRQ